MLKPVANLAGNLYGREDAIRAMRCVQAPMGCGRSFSPQEYMSWDGLTQQEYRQSGWCKGCQDRYLEPCGPGCSHDIEEDSCTCNWEPCCSVDVGVGIITCGDQHIPPCPIHDGTSTTYDPDGREDEPPSDMFEIEWSRY